MESLSKQWFFWNHLFQKREEFEMVLDEEKIDFIQAFQMPGTSAAQVIIQQIWIIFRIYEPYRVFILVCAYDIVFAIFDINHEVAAVFI